MNKALSKAEKEYIRGGSSAGVREDGRKPHEFRLLEVERDVIPHVNGSSHVKIQDAIEILCSIKLDISEPSVDTPSRGHLIFNVETSPSCSLVVDERKLAEFSSGVAHHLERIYMGCDAVDLEKLCIIEGRYCWALHVDLTILRCDGYPLDACSIATREALQSTLIPQIQLKMGDLGTPEAFDVCGDLTDSSLLDARNVPLCLTVARVGNELVSDLTLNEYSSAQYVYITAIDDNGNYCGVVKACGGAVPPAEISSLLIAGQDFLSSVRSSISNVN